MTEINNLIYQANELSKNIVTNVASASSAAATSVGSYRGEKVSLIPSLKSILAAAEELTFKAADSRSSDMAKRKVRDKLSALVDIEKLANDFLKKIVDTQKSDEIDKFVNLLSMKQFTDPDELKMFLKNQLKDISDQFAALVMARRVLAGRKQAKGLLVLINDVMHELADEESSKIKAGLNVYDTAREFASKGFASLQGLRDFYRSAVLNFKDLSTAYKDILANYGDKKITKALAFLLQGLGVELNAQTSSLDQIKLIQIIRDIKKLKFLNTLMEQVSTLFKRVGLSNDDSQEEEKE